MMLTKEHSKVYGHAMIDFEQKKKQRNRAYELVKKTGLAGIRRGGCFITYRYKGKQMFFYGNGVYICKRLPRLHEVIKVS